jgi:hypothetical protein
MATEVEHRDTRLRFEQWARNPACRANAISAVHGVPMAEVAKHEGTTPSMGQSPFAIARGQTFERALFRNQAESLRKALIRAGVLPEGSSGFQDFRLRRLGGPHQTLNDARQATADFLAEAARAETPRERRKVPTILAGPVVRIPGGIMLPEAILVIDVLVVLVESERPVLMVGEIKTYPDRGGFTDGGELAAARAQAGVYVHGLELVLEELGLAELKVAKTGFLVLSRPGFNQPSIRANEDLRYQAERAKRGFAQLRHIAAALEQPADKDTLVKAVCAAPVEYHETCISFCDRAPTCHTAALNRGDPSALGEDIARFLGETNLNRALALLAGAKPATPAEEDLVRRLNEVDGRRTKR